MKIDLHNHSKYSDGVLSVKELLNLAKEKKIDIMGLTDHDSVFGVDEAYTYGKEVGVKVLKGMELSTFHKGQTVHIVCYFKNNVIPKELYEFSQNMMKYAVIKSGFQSNLSFKIAIMKIPIMTHILEPYPLPLVELIWYPNNVNLVTILIAVSIKNRIFAEER